MRKVLTFLALMAVCVPVHATPASDWDFSGMDLSKPVPKEDPGPVFSIDVKPNAKKIVRYGQKPVVVGRSGEKAQYSIALVPVEIVVKNIGKKDETIHPRICNAVNWSRSSALVGLVDECRDYTPVPPKVLKSGDTFKSRSVLTLHEAIKPGEFRFRLGLNRGYVNGVLTEDWSDDVVLTVVEGDAGAKAKWEAAQAQA